MTYSLQSTTNNTPYTPKETASGGFGGAFTVNNGGGLLSGLGLDKLTAQQLAVIGLAAIAVAVILKRGG